MMHKYLDSKFNQMEDILIESDTQVNEEEAQKKDKWQNSPEYKQMKTNLKRLVDYNMERLKYITSLKIKKHFVKKYRIAEIKKDKLGMLERKQRIASIIIKRNEFKAMSRANSRIQGVDLHTAQNLFSDLITEIEDFVNIRIEDGKKTSPIPQKCIIYFINKLLNFTIFFERSDSETFLQYLKAVCILDDVAVTHKATVKLYHAILKGIAFKIDDERNHRKKVRVKEIKHPYERLGEGMKGFWTLKKDRLLLELYKEVKFFGPIRKYFEQHFPKSIELFSRDFFRQRTVSLLRRQIQRIRSFLSMSPASEYSTTQLLEFKPKSLNRILKSSSCIELRLMLAQTSLDQTTNLSKIEDVVSALNYFQSLDDDDQLKKIKSIGDKYAKWTGRYDDGRGEYSGDEEGAEIVEKRQTRNSRSKKKLSLRESEDSSELSDEEDELWGN